MDDEAIVEEGVSRYGLHRVHVVRMGGEVDAERWIREKTEEGGRVETFFRYEEEETGVHHLRLWWREPLTPTLSLKGEGEGEEEKEADDG
jgi:hypothetical protein